MAPSKLKLALAAEKGIDIKAASQKKKLKQTLNRKQKRAEQNLSNPAANHKPGQSRRATNSRVPDKEGSDWEDVDGSDSDGAEEGFDLEAIDDSDTSDSDIEIEEKIERRPNAKIQVKKSSKNDKPKELEESEEDDEEDDDDDEDEEEEDDEDIPMSDLEDLDDEDKDDLIPHTRLTINNSAALTASLKRIAIPTDASVSFASHQCVTSAGAPTEESIPDVSDDLNRELALYAQSLEAVKLARTKLRAEGAPFTRPNDYFAEMVKEDAHMDKVRNRLVEEASAKKAAVEARKLRDLKKFGKQVQVAKLQERHKEKREALDKIKELKRKRQDNSDDIGAREADMFDVGVDNELGKHRAKRPAPGGRGDGGAPNPKRQRKDDKFGFGGKKRFSKSGDAVSSGDLGGFNGRRSKGGPKGGPKSGPTGGAKGGKPTRLGKSRRKAMKS